MTVQVCWSNLNPTASPRGAWDQTIVNELTAGDAFVHRSVDVFDEMSGRSPKPLNTFVRPDWDRENGAVVVIPGQHNRDDEFVGPLCEFIAELPWALVIVTSDEEALFPVERLPRHEKLVIWGQYHARPEFDRVIPIGLPPNTREAITAGLDGRPELRRDLDVFFAGQNTHARREELIDTMKDMACEPGSGNISWVASTGFRAGIERDDYLACMCRTKIAPCPSGYHSLDSFRLYEAIAAGCLPVIEFNTPDGPEPHFWEHLFGNVLIPTVTTWDGLYAVQAHYSDPDRWRVKRDAIAAEYVAYRQRLARSFVATIERLSGA